MIIDVTQVIFWPMHYHHHPRLRNVLHGLMIFPNTRGHCGPDDDDAASNQVMFDNQSIIKRLKNQINILTFNNYNSPGIKLRLPGPRSRSGITARDC